MKHIEMKYIKSYKLFNESWHLPKFLRKKNKEIEGTSGSSGSSEKKTSMEIYDNVVSKIFQRIKDIFDFKNLKKNSSYADMVKHTFDSTHNNYVYNLEETDSNDGFIEVVIIKEKYANTDYLYTMKIDNVIVPCSKYILEEMYNFFDNKILNRKEIEERQKAIAFRDKYKNVTG